MLLAAAAARAQVNPPVPAPTGPVNPPGEASPQPAPSASPTAESPAPVPATPVPATPTPVPTPVPIIVDPPNPAVVLGKTVALHVTGVAGSIYATSADAAIATAVPDQNTRTLFVTGNAIGTTTI